MSSQPCSARSVLSNESLAGKLTEPYRLSNTQKIVSEKEYFVESGPGGYHYPESYYTTTEVWTDEATASGNPATTTTVDANGCTTTVTYINEGGYSSAGTYVTDGHYSVAGDVSVFPSGKVVNSYYTDEFGKRVACPVMPWDPLGVSLAEGVSLVGGASGVWGVSSATELVVEGKHIEPQLPPSTWTITWPEYVKEQKRLGKSVNSTERSYLKRNEKKPPVPRLSRSSGSLYSTGYVRSASATPTKTKTYKSRSKSASSVTMEKSYLKRNEKKPPVPRLSGKSSNGSMKKGKVPKGSSRVYEGGRRVIGVRHFDGGARYVGDREYIDGSRYVDGSTRILDGRRVVGNTYVDGGLYVDGYADGYDYGAPIIVNEAPAETYTVGREVYPESYGVREVYPESYAVRREVYPESYRGVREVYTEPRSVRKIYTEPSNYVVY